MLVQPIVPSYQDQHSCCLPEVSLCVCCMHFGKSVDGLVLTDDHRCSLFDECSSRFETLLALFHRRYSSRRGSSTTRAIKTIFDTTYSFQNVLVHPGVAQWLEVSPVEGRLATARAATERDYFEIIRSRKRRFRNYETQSQDFSGRQDPCGLHILGRTCRC